MTPRRLLLDLVATAAHGSGWTRLMRRRRHGRGDYRLYILEYHDLCGDGEVEREGMVSAERLARHLRWLGQRFQLVTVEQGARWLADRTPHPEARDATPRDRLAITFDDGYLSNFRHAWPVLQSALGSNSPAPATIYLATGFIDGEPLWFDWARHAFEVLRGQQPPALAAATRDLLQRALGAWPRQGGEVEALKYAAVELRLEVLHSLRDLQLDLPSPRPPMTWQQIQLMQAAGVEMAAHTVTHPILSRQAPAQQEDEIRRSRQRIAEATGIEPKTFAFPNGSARDYDQHTLEIVERLGFSASCTTLRGSNPPGTHPFELRRLGIGADSIPVLATRLAGLFDQGVRRFLPRAARTAPTH